MIAATAALRCIRSNYPKAHIALLLKRVCPAGGRPRAVGRRDRRGGPARRAGRDAARRRSGCRRAPRYDLALLLTQSFNSALMVRLGAGEAPRRSRARRASLAAHRRRAVARAAERTRGWSPKCRSIRACSSTSAAKARTTSGRRCSLRRRMRRRRTGSWRDARARREPAAAGPRAGRGIRRVEALAAGRVSRAWPTRWPRSRRLQAVVLTGPGEEQIAAEIARNMKEAPITFREGEVSFGALKAIVRRSSLMICNDTGPRHLAIAYNVPVVVLMGPTTRSSRRAITRGRSSCGRTCPARRAICGGAPRTIAA